MAASSGRVVMRTAALLLAGALSFTGCQKSASDVYFPTWHESGGATASGALEGHLVERSGCLYWVGQSEYLPIWPDSFQLDDSDGLRLSTASGRSLAVGDAAILAGGERTRRQVEALVGARIPTRCQPQAGFWVVTDVINQIGE